MLLLCVVLSCHVMCVQHPELMISADELPTHAPLPSLLDVTHVLVQQMMTMMQHTVRKGWDEMRGEGG